MSKLMFSAVFARIGRTDNIKPREYQYRYNQSNIMHKYVKVNQRTKDNTENYCISKFKFDANPFFCDI